jgi:hypothetical protein
LVFAEHPQSICLSFLPHCHSCLYASPFTFPPSCSNFSQSTHLLQYPQNCSFETFSLFFYIPNWPTTLITMQFLSISSLYLLCSKRRTGSSGRK